MKQSILDKQFSKKRTEGAANEVRFQELPLSKIDVAIQMIKRTISNGVIAQYVLVYSWFMCETLLKSVRALKRGTLLVV